ncbi:MFS transporter [Aliiroseovarius sp.]|uniref:MFS transporter n=1 Tax=Aliiroseovarius sp. TaxID=1872442 RepID=UPI002636C2EA|nr:MFS transporter [Aliiroseovarius sp.]
MNITALKHRDFRLYFLGNAFALNGLWMQRLTVGWLAWEMTGAPSFVGLVAFLSFAPSMITGPFFGVLVDRVRVKLAALATQGSMLLLSSLLLLSWVFGVISPPLLAVISFAHGVVASAHNPVRMSLAPRLVPPPAVPSVVALVAINFNMARLTGPALAGWIIATWGIGTVMILQVLCYLPFLGALSALRPREKTRRGQKPPFLRSLADGIRHAAREPHIRDAILATGIFAFVIRGALEILPVVADGIFSKGPAGLGVLTACAGAGALAAGFIKALTPAQTEGQLPRWALTLTLIGMGAVMLMGQSGSWALTLAIVTGLGFASSVSGISMQTTVQMGLDDDLRGRVMSLWAMVGIGAAAAGAGALGVLVELIGFPATLGLAGGAGVMALGSLMLRLR